MASALKNLSEYDETTMPDGSPFQIGIAVSDWNKHITHLLYEGAYETLLKHGVVPENITTAQVPGAFELTAAARMLAQSKKLDAVICLGCVIKGDTQHDEYINNAVAQGLTSLAIASGKAFVFGLLTVNNELQALERAGGEHGNKGVEAAQTALRMAQLRTDLQLNLGEKIAS